MSDDISGRKFARRRVRSGQTVRRRAALEAAHQALQLGSLSDPAQETTVDVTIINGGKTINVIPDSAIVKADVRAFTAGEFDGVERDLQKLAASTMIPEVQVKATMVRNFPPWARSPSTDALFTRAQKLYADADADGFGTPSAVISVRARVSGVPAGAPRPAPPRWPPGTRSGAVFDMPST
jgi:glutamate carboxypeptidase